MAQLRPLPLTVSCFTTKIQIGFTFLVPAHPSSAGKRAAKRVCVCVCVCVFNTDMAREIGTGEQEGIGKCRTCLESPGRCQYIHAGRLSANQPTNPQPINVDHADPTNH